MPNAIKLLIEHLKEIWRHFERPQKVSIIGGLAIAGVVIAGLLVWSARPDYRLLFTGLALVDTAEIRDRLNEERINIRLEDSGRTIYVKQQDLYRARLLLASEGLPRDSSASTGFELFEEPRFGLTDFAQRINYQRAVQGELQRTISAMDGVESARVMLVLPKEGLLATEEEKKATASIMIQTRNNFALSPGQVNAIVQLVSSSVKNLEPGTVTVTDQTGKLLTSGSGDPEGPFDQANDQLAAKERIELHLVQKAQGILDRALGADRSIVKVDASMNFDRLEQRSEKFDRSGRVAKTEVIESESSQTPAGMQGALTGIRANIPIMDPEAGSTDAGMAKTKKENIRSDFLVPSEVQHIIGRGGRIERLSISVAVASGAQPRPEEELKKIRDLVSNAVGFSAERTDSIEVVEMPFMVEDTAFEQWWTRFPFGFNQMGQWGIVAIVLLVAFLVMRNVMSNLSIRQEEVGVEVGELTGDVDREGGDKRGGVAVLNEEVHTLTPLEEQLQQIMSITKQNPRAVAAWVASVVES